MKRAIVFSLLGLMLIGAATAQEKIKEKELPEQYRDFLNLTRYIMLDEERDVFLRLATNRDRDVFITSFWKQRDPTPGTPKNEYREQHMERVNYANTKLARSAVRPGWMTDMGRIHIILGEPASIERFDGTMGLYPVQVWYYYGDSARGLPPHFAVVFFKRSGTGEYRLYDHMADGAASLLVDGRQMDPTDYETMYNKIRELAPTLSLVAFSMIPGDIPYNFQPSPVNNILMSQIFDSPKKDVNPTYATHFLNYKGIVSTEYMTNYIESTGHVELIRDPRMGINFLHFSVAPRNLSVDYYRPKDQYFCNFTITTSLRLDEDNIVFQYSKDFPFYFDPDDLDRIRSNGVAVEDSFPVVPGQYKLNVLLQNSVGKEFSVFERNISVPNETGVTGITGLFLGYKIQNYEEQFHIPFKILGRKLVVDPTQTFGAADQISFFLNLTDVTPEIWEQGQIRVEVTGLKPNKPATKSFSLRLQDQPFRRNLVISQSFSATELSPDYYEITVSLFDETGGKLDERISNFIISQSAAIAHPITHAKAFSLSNSFLYFYVMARQYEKTGRAEEAEATYARAFQMKPDYKRGLLDYANLLFTAGKFERMLELTEPVKQDENFRFETFLLEGKAYMGMGRYEEAIESLLQGNELYNSDIGLLNSLGFCYSKVGENEKALDALNASLRLNSEQESIQKLVAEIEKR